MIYADPGYKGAPRLPLDSAERIIAAHARMTFEYHGYTTAQRESIRARIRRAAESAGLDLSGMDRREARKLAIEATVAEGAAAKVHCATCNVDYFIDTPEEKHDHSAELAAHSGCMIALYPTPQVQEALAVPGGEAAKDIHLTLAYLGDAAGLDLDRLKSVVAGVAEGAVPMDGEISGFGVFTATPNQVVTYASADVPALAGFRQRLFDALVAASFPVATNHGYTPHMTVSYSDQRELKVPNVKLSFDSVWLVAAGQKTQYELRGDEKPYDENQHGAPEPAREQPKGYVDETERIKKQSDSPEATGPHDFTAAKWTHPNGHPRCATCGHEEPIGGRCNDPASVKEALKQQQAVELSTVVTGTSTAAWPAGAITINMGAPGTFATGQAATVFNTAPRLEPVEPELEVIPTRAFVTELNGKTILTAPVQTLKAEHVGANPHFLWMEGAFVGAEEPNRNNAFWSTADLQFGEFTVKNGPLNWLHEARHVIGSITDGRLVLPAEASAAGVRSGAALVPHIRATAAVWKWIYQEEAEVIEFAAEVGKLYYSMECISKSIKCAGDNGCGESFDYLKAMHGQACEHIVNRSSMRHLVQPTFLGGAILVPPVRPGWAHADVTMLKQAAKFAEKSYEDAGRPDIEAAVWEQIMAELVLFSQPG